MEPLVSFLEIKANPPHLGDNTADLDRLRRAVAEQLGGREPRVAWSRTAPVAAAFRAAGFGGTAVLNHLAAGVELVDFLPGLATSPLAMALDLGTTHLEATLLDLATGAQLARAHQENSQIRFGADILSRIHHAASPGGLAALHAAVLGDINALARRLAGAVGIEAAAIRALSVAGNTAMSHFFLNLNPHHLIREPYIPMVNVIEPPAAGELGLAIHPAAPVWVLPSVGSYFGGDLVAGVLACGMAQGEEVTMLIDVGTNAEVIVGNRDWLMACAGAAGPALEGGVARMGMRAGPGAIDHVEYDSATATLRYTTIGGEPPRGLCGSGVIDLAAALYLGRLIDLKGKFRPAVAGNRLVDSPDGPALVVAPAGAAADGRPVLFAQTDLDAVMRSKAAMYAILTTLINQVGGQFTELAHIYVAGAFGRHINPRSAITLGMLPDLPLATYVPVGNSSLAGAELVLRDGDARRAGQALVRKITYLELNVNQEFMLRFSGSRFIPHTDHGLFPSVPFFGDL
ncbi:MAG: ATP-binding protein [Desulfobulbaceae bacterium]|nr:ATP-binding protein [Desulfobulbaceae bacterium]